MKKLTEKYKKKLHWIVPLWLISLALFIAGYCNYTNQIAIIPSYEEFTGMLDIQKKEDKVGAKVWLKEAIHSTGGKITYRYKVETDCPQWYFSTVYTTISPVEWVTDDTAAVEVLITDIQMRYNGTVYASGQYYTVPLFGGLSSEEVPELTWETNLAKFAYQGYCSDAPAKAKWFVQVMGFIVFVLPVMLIVCAYSYGPEKKKE